MKNILESHEILLNNWERDLTSKNLSFDRDGIISPDGWEQAKVKVLFVLKETNQKKEDWGKSRNIAKEIAKAINNPKSGWWRKNVLRRVGRWAFGLTSYAREVPSFRDARSYEKEAIASIAYVNLKKTPGGARAKKKEFNLHVEEYAPFIKNQIELIGPNIVVLGGTCRQIKDFVFPDLKFVCERVHIYNGVVFINAFHPAQSKISAEKLYLQVLESYHKYKLQNL